MKKTIKFEALLLALCMMLSLCNFPAFAEESKENKTTEELIEVELLDDPGKKEDGVSKDTNQPVTEVPAQTVVEAPAQSIAETPAQPVVESPAQSIVEAPAQPVVEAPVQQSVVEASAQQSVIETPALQPGAVSIDISEPQTANTQAPIRSRLDGRRMDFNA